MCVNIRHYSLIFLHIKIGIDRPTPLQNVDMVGCRRRRAYDLQASLGRAVDFQCIGQNGPPCTAKIGDTVNFTATINTGTLFLIFRSRIYIVYLKFCRIYETTAISSCNVSTLNQ